MHIGILFKIPLREKFGLLRGDWGVSDINRVW